MFIQLKTIREPEQRFGALVEPNLFGRVSNDAQLSETIRKAGSARVALYALPGWTVEKVETLTPEEFNARWIGD